MNYRYRIVSSESYDNINSGCSLRLLPGSNTSRICVSYVIKKNSSNNFTRSNNFIRLQSSLFIRLNNEKFEIPDRHDQANDYVIKSIYLMQNEIKNKFERTEFIFNFLRDYCMSNIFEIGDSQFLKIQDQDYCVLLVREPWSEEDELITLEKAMTKNMSFIRNKNYNKAKTILYNKEVGNIQKPDGWDFVESGNSALTRHLKKNGPVWDIIEFKDVYIYGSGGKALPQKVGYMAPRANVVAARNYVEKNRVRLKKEKIMRRINGKIKNDIYPSGAKRLNSNQKKLLMEIFNKNKEKF